MSNPIETKLKMSPEVAKFLQKQFDAYNARFQDCDKGMHVKHSTISDDQDPDQWECEYCGAVIRRCK